MSDEKKKPTMVRVFWGWINAHEIETVQDDYGGTEARVVIQFRSGRTLELIGTDAECFVNEYLMNHDYDVTFEERDEEGAE